MRLNLWNNVLEDLGPPEGCIAPWWLVAAYCLLFPVKGLRYFLDRTSPFDLFTHTWTIHGVRYDDRFFRHITLHDDCWFKVVEGPDGVKRYITLRPAPTATVHLPQP